MDKLGDSAERALQEGVFPSCVIGTIRDGAQEIREFGAAYPVYDVASITKSIPLASLAAIYLAEKRLALADSVKAYVPELQNDYGATIEDLLRYRVRGTQLSTLQFETFEEIRTHALERGFSAPPGDFHYTNLPAFVLGIAIERIGGSPLHALAHRHLFEPLRMDSTTFFPARDDCAPTEIVGGETIQGIPHDESARVFARARRTVGHAGLFSSAHDLLTFAAHLIDHPESPITQAAQKGLGWQIADANFMGTYYSPRTFGKTGFTGTGIMVDVERKIALVILSNRTYPKRSTDDGPIRAFRRSVADIVFGS